MCKQYIATHANPRWGFFFGSVLFFDIDKWHVDVNYMEKIDQKWPKHLKHAKVQVNSKTQRAQT